jgi:formyltetrahydrofolate deformylase
VETTRLLLSCPDRPGIVARVAGFLADAGRNIIDADQHSTDRAQLFMRLVFESAPANERDDLYGRFERGPSPLDGAPLRRGRPIAAGRSDGLRDDHRLLDLLWRLPRASSQVSRFW